MPLFFVCLTAETAPAAPGFDWKIILAFVGVIILAFLMPRLVRRATRERQAFVKQCNREVAEQAEIKTQADRIMVELVEAGQEINAQLDTKMRVLNHLVRDAEKVAERLEKQLNRLEKLPEPPAAPEETPQAPAAPADAVTDANAATVILQRPPAPLPAERPELTSTDARRESDTDSGRWRMDIRQKIEHHHRAHRTPVEIARLLHLSLSEVNLVIDMYEARLAENGLK